MAIEGQSSVQTLNATQVLRDAHRKVEELFRKFNETDDAQEIKRIVDSVCNNLNVHSAIEEEIFYPAVRQELQLNERIDESLEEHQTAKELIDGLQRIRPDDPDYEQKFAVLVENVSHHIQQEETQLFPKVEQSSMEQERLGEQLLARQQELMSSLQQPGQEASAPERARGQAKHQAGHPKKGHARTKGR